MEGNLSKKIPGDTIPRGFFLRDSNYYGLKLFAIYPLFFSKAR